MNNKTYKECGNTEHNRTDKKYRTTLQTVHTIIDDIRLVINFDVPHDSEDYVHRIGRTARANNDGVALTFVSEKEQSNFKSIENFLEKEIYKIPIPTELGEAPEYKPRSFSNKGGNYSKRRNFKGKRNNGGGKGNNRDRKSTRLNSSHPSSSRMPSSA